MNRYTEGFIDALNVGLLTTIDEVKDAIDYQAKVLREQTRVLSEANGRARRRLAATHQRSVVLDTDLPAGRQRRAATTGMDE